MAKTLEILKVECRAALVDRTDMVDHLCRSRCALLKALLAERLLLQLHRPQFAPCCRLVELRIGVDPSFVRLMFRQPRTATILL